MTVIDKRGKPLDTCFGDSILGTHSKALMIEYISKLATNTR